MPTTDPLLGHEGGADEQPRHGVAIALSGGGYRAMLFHLGALWRMGQIGLFRDAALTHLGSDGRVQDVGKLERISSVSGGSITSAVLALNLSTIEGEELHFNEAYSDLVVAPIRKLASTDLAGTSLSAAWQVLKAVVMPGSVNEHIAAAYDRLLFKGKTLQDLPDRVRFIFNASNLQSGSVWRFSKAYMRDWRVGMVAHPTTPLATVVAASSAFPPVLAPAQLDLRGQAIVAGGGELKALQTPAYTRRPSLADGGVYDNLGLESCYKSYQTLFVSNAGKPFEPQEKILRNWLSLGNRCIDVMDNQVLSLRKRLLLDALVRKKRFGAFWDIQQRIDTHPCDAKLECRDDRSAELKLVPTDLQAKDRRTQERLINWGYAIADASMRAWFKPIDPPSPEFPYPAAGV